MNGEFFSLMSNLSLVSLSFTRNALSGRKQVPPGANLPYFAPGSLKHEPLSALDRSISIYLTTNIAILAEKDRRAGEVKRNLPGGVRRGPRDSLSPGATFGLVMS